LGPRITDRESSDLRVQVHTVWVPEKERTVVLELPELEIHNGRSKGSSGGCKAALLHAEARQIDAASNPESHPMGRRYRCMRRSMVSGGVMKNQSQQVEGFEGNPGGSGGASGWSPEGEGSES
jgi:hypothetical protein